MDSMNWAFFTFNAVFLIGLVAYESQLSRKARELRQYIADEDARLTNKEVLLEASRVYLKRQRDQIDSDFVQLIKAAEIVDRNAAMFGGEQEDPGDCDPSQRRWMVN
jgi:hypothetical protein